MGSSKSAQALITQFNYEELGMNVWLIKPSTDTRDGADIIKSRIGLMRHARIITPDQNVVVEYKKAGKFDVIIADEAQFMTPTCPVYQNVDAMPYTDAETIKKNLIAQLTAPVRWTQIVEKMIADGVTEFSELGPGNVLQGLVSKVSREVKTESKSTL